MAEPQAVLGLYLHLARACDLRQRPLVRDKFLILAGSISAEMNLPSVAHFCRRQILGHNPGHLLRQFPTFRHAGDDERFNLYLASLQRQYPVEKSEMMLESLGIDRARERATFESDVEYAASLLGTTPEELERWSEEPSDVMVPTPGPIPSHAPPQQQPAAGPEFDFMSSEPLLDDPALNQLLMEAVQFEADLPTTETPAPPDTFAPPPRETEIMELGEDSAYEIQADPPRPLNLGGPPGLNGAANGGASSAPHGGAPYPNGSAGANGGKNPTWLPSRVEGRSPVNDSEDSFFGETLTKHGLGRCPDYGPRGDRNTDRPGADRGAGGRGNATERDRDRAAWGSEPSESAGPASSLSLNRLLPTGPEAFRPNFESLAPPDALPPTTPVPPTGPTPAAPAAREPASPPPSPPAPVPPAAATPPHVPSPAPSLAPMGGAETGSPLWNAAAIPVNAGSVTARNNGSATLSGEWRLPGSDSPPRSDWVLSGLMLVGVGGFGFSIIYYLLTLSRH